MNNVRYRELSKRFFAHPYEGGEHLTAFEMVELCDLQRAHIRQCDERLAALLEACESMEHWLSAPPTSNSDRACVSALIRCARAIIAKTKEATA